MKHFSATDAKNKFGELLEEAANEPVVITRNGRDYRVILSVEEYERISQENQVRPQVKEAHRRSMERRRKVYEALAR